MNKKHQQQACGCLLIGLAALGVVACAVTRIVQEIQKRADKTQAKTEQRQVQKSYRIRPSDCR